MNKLIPTAAVFTVVLFAKLSTGGFKEPVAQPSVSSGLMECSHAPSSQSETTLLTFPGYDGPLEIFTKTSERSSDKLILWLSGADSEGISQEPEYSNWYAHWTQKGYHFATVSLPGVGRSKGPKDLCGPKTMHALNLALNHIKEKFGIKMVAIIGHGIGGWAGILLSAQRMDIKSIVTANGIVNLAQQIEKPQSPFMNQVRERNYFVDLSKDQEVQIRTPIEHIHQIEASVFVIHRDAHWMVGNSDAEAFASALSVAGKECQIKFLPGQDGKVKISFDEVIEHTEAWLDRCMQMD